MKKSESCRHNFVFQSYSGHGRGGRKVKSPLGNYTTKGLVLGFQCTRCNERVERKATPGERKFHAEWNSSIFKPLPIHKVWHEFMRKFMPENKKTRQREWLDIPSIALMDRIEKWAEKYPKDVFCLSVDDSHFTSSLLVLVDHKTEDKYMGTSVVMISQCSGAPPAEFFLYPGHRDGLIAALVGIRAAARPVLKRESAMERSRAKETRKNLRHPAVI